VLHDWSDRVIRQCRRVTVVLLGLHVGGVIYSRHGVFLEGLHERALRDDRVLELDRRVPLSFVLLHELLLRAMLDGHRDAPPVKVDLAARH